MSAVGVAAARAGDTEEVVDGVGEAIVAGNYDGRSGWRCGEGELGVGARDELAFNIGGGGGFGSPCSRNSDDGVGVGGHCCRWVAGC